MIRPKSDPSLKNVGERGFLNQFLPDLAKRSSSSFLVPPGDDAAVLKQGSRPVLSVDGLTEGTHFKLTWARKAERITGVPMGQLLGWKLMGCALSDLAAMGGATHRWAMIYLGAPGSTKLRFLKDFYQGVKEASTKMKCVLAGGDTVKAKQLTLVASVGGMLGRTRALVRSGAEPGNLVCMAGTVGDATVGLGVLESHVRLPRSRSAYFVRRFFEHTPLFPQAEILSKERDVTSLIDLSDSVAESMGLICQASQVGSVLEINNIPVSDEYARLFHNGPQLLTGGEDYSLLFTLRPQAYERLRKKMSFSVVGLVVPKKNKTKFTWGGKPISAPHFFQHY